MPERTEKLKSTIRELEAELASLESVDRDTRQALETAIKEISEALRRTDIDSLSHQHSLVERLQDAAEAFETSHPTLSGIIGRTINALGQMGI